MCDVTCLKCGFRGISSNVNCVTQIFEGIHARSDFHVQIRKGGVTV